MTTSFPKVCSAFALAAALLSPVLTSAQSPAAGSSAREIQTQADKMDKVVTDVIARAEDHYKKGILNLKDKKQDQARDEFDKAVDTILESGMDVRASQRLQAYYSELVERIYRLEVPQTRPALTAAPTAEVAVAQTPIQDAPLVLEQRDQGFTPLANDELARIQLTAAEQVVTQEEIQNLEMARTSVDINFQLDPRIQQYINYYQGNGRRTMESGLRRSGYFMKMARRVFREEGVPEDLTWLGQVESAWQPKARSWAAASGLWQFIPGTGARFGLRQTAWIDERNSFEQATRASARYLKFLANRYNGNWELAMAAYNSGEGNVDRAISRAGASNFWVAYQYLPQETRNYVPNILATILIAKNPGHYGFAHIRPEAPLSYEFVHIPYSASLNLIADATDVNIDVLRSFNPELRRDRTPPEGFVMRIPGGRAKQLLAVLKKVPNDKRENGRLIAVAPGEDLARVAQRTGYTLEALQEANQGVDVANPGNKLVAPNTRTQAVVYTQRAGARNSVKGTRSVTVAAGLNTVALVAAKYGVAAEDVAKLNGVTLDASFQNGQVIFVPAKK